MNYTSIELLPPQMDIQLSYIYLKIMLFCQPIDSNTVAKIEEFRTMPKGRQFLFKKQTSSD